MGHSHEITHLIHVDPTRARERILDVLTRAGMCKTDAVKEIGCGFNTMTKWIEILKLDAVIERMTRKAIREGWHHGRLGGRPRDPVRVRAAKKAGRIPRAPRRSPKKRRRSKKRLKAT